jgi:hypothetical protein
MGKMANGVEQFSIFMTFGVAWQGVQLMRHAFSLSQFLGFDLACLPLHELYILPNCLYAGTWRVMKH